ncbi:hypothetical protein ACTFIZ_008668 [Dictyostelium cf. discoideum]
MISSLNSINTLFINKKNIKTNYEIKKKDNNEIKNEIINEISKELGIETSALLLEKTLDQYKISDESSEKIKEFLSSNNNNFNITQIKNLKIIDIIEKTIYQNKRNNYIKLSKL